jgi:multiple sugar transport system substrate-binding protein
MKPSKARSILLAIALTFGITAVTAFATGFTYDPSKAVNDGKPIMIEFWTWGTLDLFKSLGSEYTKVHPNVTFKFVENSWDDYWTKLPLAIQNGIGPDAFNFHNSKEDLLLQYMAPYDMDLSVLKAEYLGIDSHLVNNKLYYTDYGFMTGAIYYNKKLWKAAGLTDKDMPKTWDDLRKVAKKLTRYDAKNAVSQAGFNFNGQYQAIIAGLNYQKASLMFKNDRKSINFETPASIENTKFLKALYDVDKVGSKDFGVDCLESFGQEKTAMVYAWGWFKNYLPDRFPDVDWGVFNVPSFYADKPPFAYDRYNGESTWGINAKAKPENQAVAQDFVRFFMTNDMMLKKFCLMFGTFPAKISLKNDKDVLNDPLMKVLSKIIDRTIWPGVMPSPIEDNLKKTIQDILYNGMSVEDAVKQTQKQMVRDLRNVNFTSVEDKYKYFSEMGKYTK